MEKVKKTILQVVCTGKTSAGDIIIEPDLNAVYYLKIGLKESANDLGFFDSFDDSIVIDDDSDDSDVHDPINNPWVEYDNPEVYTKVADGVTETSIIGTGGFDIIHYDEIVTYYMEYKTTVEVDWKQTTLISGPLLINSYSANIEGLLSGVEYKYRAVMIVGDKTYHGDDMVITTTAGSVVNLPTVVTGVVPENGVFYNNFYVDSIY